MPSPIPSPLSIPSIRPDSIASIDTTARSGIAAPSVESQKGSFQSILANAVETVQASDTAARASVEQLLAGENIEIHQVALASQKAELNFDLFMAVRNKVVSAYQEVMRMQM